MPFGGWYGKIIFDTEQCVSGSTIIAGELVASFKGFQGAKPVFDFLLLRDERKIWIFS